MAGESVLSLLVVELSDEILEFYITFYIGIMSVILMQYLFFKSQPHHATDHANFRSIGAALQFMILLYIYSASLILVGVSYKMLLTEFQIEREEASLTDKSVMPSERSLASNAYGETKDSSKDVRRQKISNIFCIAMATSFISLDLMGIVHRGPTKAFQRLATGNGGITKARNIVPILRAVGALLIGTACIYLNNPMYVALAGLMAVLYQVGVRFLGQSLFPPDKNKPEFHTSIQLKSSVMNSSFMNLDLSDSVLSFPGRRDIESIKEDSREESDCLEMNDEIGVNENVVSESLKELIP